MINLIYQEQQYLFRVYFPFKYIHISNSVLSLQLWEGMKKQIHSAISCPHLYNFDYLRDYFNELRDYNKFAIVVNNLIHDELNRLEVADNDTLNFLKMVEKSEHVNNTIIMIIGDHGIRAVEGFRATYTGKLEERSPMFSITLPPRFEAYREEMEHLYTNSQVMTTQYDVYDTFQHISTFPKMNKNVHVRKYGRSLFTDIASLNRSCPDVGLDTHWCKCLNYENVDPDKDRIVHLIVIKVLSFINNRNEATAPNKCHPLKLLRVTRAGRRTINQAVNQFNSVSHGWKSWWSSQEDKPVFSTDRHMLRYSYEVYLKVAPSNGEYEVHAEVVLRSTTDFTVTLNEEISRISHYNNQPACIYHAFPHLRKYCFCKDFKGKV